MNSLALLHVDACLNTEKHVLFDKLRTIKLILNTERVFLTARILRKPELVIWGTQSRSCARCHLTGKVEAVGGEIMHDPGNCHVSMQQVHQRCSSAEVGVLEKKHFVCEIKPGWE